MKSIFAFIFRSVLALGLAACLPAAFADQKYPDRPVKIVVPFSAGGSADTTTRLLASKLSDRLKKPFVVDNRTGASGTIGGLAVSKSPADGYTLMTLASPGLFAQHMQVNPQYDVHAGFSPVASFYDLPLFLVVNPEVLPDVHSLEQLIALARRKSGELAYTSSGIGSFGHLSVELLKSVARLEMRHVPYRGGSAAIGDVLGGQIPVMMADAVIARPQIEAGKLRAIAVASPERVGFFPDVKTIAEQGFPGFSAVSWGAILAPAGTPGPVVDLLSREIGKVMEEPGVQASFQKMGLVGNYRNAPETAARMQADFDKWGEVIRINSIRSE